MRKKHSSGKRKTRDQRNCRCLIGQSLDLYLIIARLKAFAALNQKPIVSFPLGYDDIGLTNFLQFRISQANTQSQLTGFSFRLQEKTHSLQSGLDDHSHLPQDVAIDVAIPKGNLQIHPPFHTDPQNTLQLVNSLQVQLQNSLQDGYSSMECSMQAWSLHALHLTLVLLPTVWQPKRNLCRVEIA